MFSEWGPTGDYGKTLQAGGVGREEVMSGGKAGPGHLI